MLTTYPQPCFTDDMSTDKALPPAARVAPAIAHEYAWELALLATYVHDVNAELVFIYGAEFAALAMAAVRLVMPSFWRSAWDQDMSITDAVSAVCQIFLKSGATR